MDYIKVNVSFLEVLEPLNDTERGRLITGMLEYVQTGEQPNFKGNERFVWPQVKQSIEREAAYIAKQKGNGGKGGRPKETQTNPPEPNKTQTNPQEPNKTQRNQEKPKETPYNDNDNDNDNDKREKISPIGDKKKISRFSPPSPDEVSAYCRENGYQVDGQAFCDFYASKGWRVGNQPMKDWQAAVRTWARHDAKPSAQRPVKTVTAQQYQQREYTDDELNAVSGDLIAEARKGAAHE